MHQAIRVAPVDPADPRARACVAAYVAELVTRFEEGFDPAQSLPAQDDELRPPAGVFLVALRDDTPVGCIAVKLHGVTQPAEIKRMWVSESVRGMGLGRSLLSAVEDFSRGHNVPTLRLETNRALTEAIALYRSAGYREVPAFNDERFAHHWFEKPLEP